MDSMVSNVNKLVILQIAQIYLVPATESHLSIHSISVQQQKGSMKCGLFAIAFAIEICTGHNPSDAEFVQSEMRPHLVNCLKIGKLSRFPQQSLQYYITHSKPKVFNIKVYCMCRMPDNFDENIVQCTNCHGWYHYRCVKMRTKRSVHVNWKCSKCLHGKKQ